MDPVSRHRSTPSFPLPSAHARDSATSAPTSSPDAVTLSFTLSAGVPARNECDLPLRLRPLTDGGAGRLFSFADLREEVDRAMRPGSYDLDSDAVDGFDRLASQQPHVASDLVESWLAEIETGASETAGQRYRRSEAFAKIALALSGSVAPSATRRVVTPFVPRFATLLSRMQAADRLGDRRDFDPYPVRFCGALAEAFPDLLDNRFIEQEASVLLHSPQPTERDLACGLLDTLWQRRPDLVAPTLAVIAREPDRSGNSRGPWFLVAQGIRLGWRPDGPQMSWIQASACASPAQGDTSLLCSPRFLGALRALRTLHELGSPLLNGLHAPDAQGRLQPLRRALLDRVMHDPDPQRCLRLFERRDPFGVADDLYRFVFPDAEQVRTLLEQVERGSAHLPLREMCLDDQTAFVVLASLALAPEENHRFEKVLCAHVDEEPAVPWLEGPLSRGRDIVLRAHGEALARGTLSAEEAGSLLLRAAETACHAFRVPPKSFEAIEKLCLSWADGLRAGPPGSQVQAEQWLLVRVEPLLQAGDLFRATPSELTCLTMLDVLSRTDAPLQARLRALVGSRLDTRQTQGDGLAACVLRSIRKTSIKRLVLDSEGVRSERLAALSQTERIGEAELQIGRHAAHALGVGALRDALAGGAVEGLARLARQVVEPENVLTVYRALAPALNRDEDLGAESARFIEVMERVGGESALARALETHEFVERACSRGYDRDAALALALDAHARGTTPDLLVLDGAQPPSTPPEVERDDRGLRIGGISIPVRSYPHEEAPGGETSSRSVATDPRSGDHFSD